MALSAFISRESDPNYQNSLHLCKSLNKAVKLGFSTMDQSRIETSYRIGDICRPVARPRIFKLSYLTII